MECAIGKALECAQKSSLNMRHGSVLCTKSGKIVTCGRNHERVMLNRRIIPCCHAEIDALRRHRPLWGQKWPYFESRTRFLLVGGGARYC